MPRLFIGIPVPDSYQEKFASLVETLTPRLKSVVRWVRPGNLHITLRFLGEVESAAVDTVAGALGVVIFPAFHLRIGGCSGFPDLVRPRSLWAGVMKGARRCTELADAVSRAVALHDFVADRKIYTPHLTLGRIKQAGADDWQEILPKACGVWPGFKVEEFVLWQSTLTPEGPIYTAVREFPLTQA